MSDRKIDFSLYKPGDDGVLRYNGQTLESDMHRAAEEHFTIRGENGEGITVYNVVGSAFNDKLPLYTFTTYFDPITYAKNTKSYSSIEQ
jgi:hypothetical protein